MKSLLVKLLVACFCVSAFTLGHQQKQKATADSTTTKPHILVLLVDDWGWANVGYHRNPPTPEVVTPNIDSLKEQGLELDQHYTYQFCSPTRSSFLTGRLPIHVNDKNVPGNHYNPKDPISGFSGIPRNMTTIATKLKEAGYEAHTVGKWHAGMATPTHMPTGRGFTTSYGYLNGYNDYYTEIFGLMRSCNNKTALPDLWDTDHPANKDNGTKYEETLFVERVLDIIEHHDPSVPLFLYYTPHLVHAPLEVPDYYSNKFKFINDTDRRIYHGMVNYMDDIVGNITKALKKRGLWDNLFFLLSSDNGGPLNGGANNYPLKGGKMSNWQGGSRVTAFVTGGFLPKEMVGKKTEQYIHIADWYSTFCSLVGVDPTDKEAAKANLPPIDSLDMWPLISGKNTTSPRVEMALNTQTLISGNYKIIAGNADQAGWTGPQYPNTTGKAIKTVEHCGDGCLYDIMKDPEERVNIASTMPDVLKEMQKKLKKAQDSYFNPDRGEEWPDACQVFDNKYGGFWGPFLP